VLDNLFHRHITVNGDVTSYHLKPGDKVVREKSKSLEAIERSLSNQVMFMNGLLGIMMLKKVLFCVPARLQIPENIKEQLIVELYNK
jgi:small subunit ribosomal protein S4